MNALAATLLAMAASFAAVGDRRRSRSVLWRRVGVRTTAPATTWRAPSVRRLFPPVAGLLGGFALGALPGAVVGAGIGLAVRWLGPRRSRARRSAERDEQLADAVAAIASAMRAGQSMAQALSYAADEAGTPLREDLSALVHELELGGSFDAALIAFGDRIGTEDARLTVAALAMHRRTGGDLPVVLDQVASTVRERSAMAREVRALTAQARLSGAILGLLPFGFFAFLWVTSRSDIEAALSTPAGLASVVIGLVLEGGAFLWIRKLLVVA